MKKMLNGAFALGLMLMVGCGQKVVYLDAEGNEIEPQKEVEYLYQTGDRFEIVEEIDYCLSEVRDTQTGVHYYLYELRSKIGGLSLTPIYESDGSVRVSN